MEFRVGKPNCTAFCQRWAMALLVAILRRRRLQRLPLRDGRCGFGRIPPHQDARSRQRSAGEPHRGACGPALHRRWRPIELYQALERHRARRSTHEMDRDRPLKCLRREKLLMMAATAGTAIAVKLPTQTRLPQRWDRHPALPGEHLLIRGETNGPNQRC